MSINSTLTVGIAALVLSALGMSANVSAAPKNSHLLAIGVCPPWKVIEDDPKTTKLMAESCAVDVNTIIPAIRKSFAVAEANVSVRLNEEADYAGVSDAFTLMAARAKPEDRVVIYINMHGGDIAAEYQGLDVEDAVLATYSEKEPTDFAAATANGTWMPMKKLRDLVDKIKAEEIIVIFEVCEVAAGLKDYRYDLASRYAGGWKGREAVIFSSRGDQSATYTEDGTVALFTSFLSKRLLETSSGNIRDVVEAAGMDTHRSRRATCMKQDNLDTLYDDRATYLDACTQMPNTFDPYGLLDDIQVGGTTISSRWNEILSQNRKPPEKTKTAKKDKDNGKPSATADADPFAWTRAIVAPQSQGYGNVYNYPEGARAGYGRPY